MGQTQLLANLRSLPVFFLHFPLRFTSPTRSCANSTLIGHREKVSNYKKWRSESPQQPNFLSWTTFSLTGKAENQFFIVKCTSANLCAEICSIPLWFQLYCTEYHGPTWKIVWEWFWRVCDEIGVKHQIRTLIYTQVIFSILGRNSLF